MEPKVVRVTVDLSDSQVAEITLIARRNGITLTEVIRHAIMLEAMVQDEHARGSKILIKERSGNMKRILVDFNDRYGLGGKNGR